MTQVAEMSVVCVVLIRDQRVFLAQRTEPDFLAGKWEFPGGKIESNESELEAVSREIREELNIELVSPTPLLEWFYSTPHRTLKFNSFICKAWIGEFSLTEHSAFKWVHWKKLSPDEMPEADGPLVEYLKRNSSMIFGP